MRLQSLIMLGIFAVSPSIALAADGVTVLKQTPNGPVSVFTPAPEAVTSTTVKADGSASHTVDEEKTAIGFDAKVKRDPNGKIISDDKTAGTAAPTGYIMRTDQTLRGDKELMKR